MDNTKEFTHLGLCAGYGGIELGLHRVIRTLRTVALCEIEAFACANLVAKMEAGLMDCAPIWTNLKTFPWSDFRDRVDLLTGGYPCQPFSAAGKRLGTEDPRHLWPFIADGIRILRPKLCFFENVEGHISLGLREVIGELESIGYTAAWGIFSASECGAPHQRKRVFILAYRKGERLPQFANIRAVGREVCATSLGGQLANGNEQRLERGIQPGVSPKEKQNEFVAGYGCALANSNGARGWEDRESSESWAACTEQPSSDSRGSESGQIREGQAWPSRPGEPQHAWEPPRVVADARCGKHGWREIGERPIGGASCELGEANEALGNADHGRLASGLNAGSGTEADRGGQSDIEQADGGMGNAEIVRAQGQWAEQQTARAMQSSCPRAISNQGNGQTQPPLGRDADGPAGGMGYAELQVTCDNRTDELRLLGNGVVPATAERAFLTLSEELLKGTI